MIFDSHAHYDDEQFDIDRDQVLKELKEAGIVGVLNCGASMESSKKTLEIINKNDYFYGAVGVHPEYAYEINEDTLKELKMLAQNIKVKAIGEIGLDYYWEENPSKEIQIEAFKKQMKLAEELNLPVVIHDREAHEDTLKVMKEYHNVRGVVHCFSGSSEFAKECLKLGYYIGFTGVITFKNAKKIVDVAKIVPIEKILVETDCPYMTPAPFRGKRNRSEYIRYIIEKLSEIKEVEKEKLSYQTILNTRNLLKI